MWILGVDDLELFGMAAPGRGYDWPWRRLTNAGSSRNEAAGEDLGETPRDAAFETSEINGAGGSADARTTAASDASSCDAAGSGRAIGRTATVSSAPNSEKKAGNHQAAFNFFSHSNLRFESSSSIGAGYWQIACVRGSGVVPSGTHWRLS
jgi:hypothetical protein